MDNTNLSCEEQTRFNGLMQDSYKKVFNMAFRLSGNRPDAEDLTQEAFFRAYRSFRDFEGDRPFENWIFRIVTRLFLDMLRSKNRRIKPVSFDSPITREMGDDSLFFDMPDARPNPEQQTLNLTLEESLERTLETLSPEQRLLVTLADIEQIPYKEIAEIMNKPVGTIRSRLHRTHKLIRARLEKLRSESGGLSTRSLKLATS